MELKENIDYPAFWKTVRSCESDVIFITKDGDNLNLRSTICQFILTVYLSNGNHSFRGQIQCRSEKDARLLKDFCR